MGRIYSSYPITLPVNVTIKMPGGTERHLLKEGEEVVCRLCGAKFCLDNDAVFRFRHKYDDGVKVQCPHCGKVVDIAYYVNESNRVKLTTWDSKFVKTI